MSCTVVLSEGGLRIRPDPNNEEFKETFDLLIKDEAFNKKLGGCGWYVDYETSSLIHTQNIVPLYSWETWFGFLLEGLARHGEYAVEGAVCLVRHRNDTSEQDKTFTIVARDNHYVLCSSKSDLVTTEKAFVSDLESRSRRGEYNQTKGGKPYERRLWTTDVEACKVDEKDFETHEREEAAREHEEDLCSYAFRWTFFLFVLILCVVAVCLSLPPLVTTMACRDDVQCRVNDTLVFLKAVRERKQGYLKDLSNHVGFHPSSRDMEEIVKRMRYCNNLCINDYIETLDSCTIQETNRRLRQENPPVFDEVPFRELTHAEITACFNCPDPRG